MPMPNEQPRTDDQVPQYGSGHALHSEHSSEAYTPYYKPWASLDKVRPLPMIPRPEVDGDLWHGGEFSRAEVKELLLKAVEDGETISEVCDRQRAGHESERQWWPAVGTVYAWMAKDQEFGQRMLVSMQSLGDQHWTEALHEARAAGPITAAAASVKVKALMASARQFNPQVFGERKTVDVNLTDVGRLNRDQVKAEMAMLLRDPDVAHLVQKQLSMEVQDAEVVEDEAVEVPTELPPEAAEAEDGDQGD